MQQYFSQINANSGGRLNSFAVNGTPAVNYAPLTAEELRSLGGAGATRIASAERQQGQATERINADPSLSVFQKQRALQLTGQDASSNIDAINKETEAMIAQLADAQHKAQYGAALNNAGLTAKDMELLAQIFFGGKGSNSSSSGSGFNFGVGSGGGGSKTGGSIE